MATFAALRETIFILVIQVVQGTEACHAIFYKVQIDPYFPLQAAGVFFIIQVLSALIINAVKGIGGGECPRIFSVT